MGDFIFVSLTLLFFALATLYAVALDRLDRD